MPKKPKRKRYVDLPYWPSEAFIKESTALLREKGMKQPDDVLREVIIGAYRKKRTELLADKAMKSYEDS